MAAEAGETVQLNLMVKNKGWDSTANMVTATLSCNDELVTINDETVTVSFSPMETRMVSYTVSLAAGIASGHTTEFNVHFTDANGYNITETIDITFGKPMLKFFDDTENGLAQWEADGSWNVTTEKSASGSHSFTESPYGTYSPNDEMSLTTATAIDLTGLAKATLSFQTRYNMEKDWDLAQLQISSNNGSTWTPLWGEYATNGSDGEGLQLSNEPVYNGFRDLFWVEEKASLDAYLGQQVLIRFLLASDAGIQTDGWYVDDIKVIGFTDIASVPQIITFTKYQNTSFLGAYPIHAVVSDEKGNLTVNLKYSTDSITFNSVQMAVSDFFHFAAEIPMMELGTTVYYYIEATDDDNNTVTSEVREFMVTDQPPVLDINISEINEEMGIGQTSNHMLTITNNGLLPLTWSITGIAGETKDPVLSITDPVGDNQGNSPDFVSVYSEILESGSLYLQMNFADEIDTNTMFAILLTDIDQNPATGLTGAEMFGYPAWDIAAEFFIVWDVANQNGLGSAALVIDTNDEFMGFEPIVVDGNSMSVTFPLSYLGNDDGNMDIAAICGSEAGFDAAPNEGHGTIGMPGFASWLSYNVSAGTVYAGESFDVTVTTKSTTTPPGVYEAFLMLETNDQEHASTAIPVTMTVLSNQANIESFAFNEQSAPATINPNTRVISISVNPGTNLTNLAAIFTLSDGATAFIGDVAQESGITVNDFSALKLYRIVAEDGVTSKTWRVNVSVAVGIGNTETSSFIKYPNPANDKLTIRGVNSGTAVIYSMVGEKVLQIENDALQQPIDVSMLSDGLYVVTILENNTTKTKLLQINR